VSSHAESKSEALLRYDRLRAENYALLGALLARPPTAELLGKLSAASPPDDTGIGAMWRALAEAAAMADEKSVAEEYQQLFIGIGRGELVPFASWYLTGFLMEQPLTVLRDDLIRLGFKRQEGVHEPEDHIASLSEVMSMLVADKDLAAAYEGQRDFYNHHLAPFVGRFWRDLEGASGADFYRAVARLGGAFCALEQEYFSLPA